MKRFLLSLVCVLSAVIGVNAQNWSTTLTAADGLPGVAMDYSNSGTGYYEFTSQLLSPGVQTNRVRMTVVGTVNNEAPNGNNIIFSLSELKIYDKDGQVVPYTASSNADHNSLSWESTDGSGLLALDDNNYKTYFHSMWSSFNAVADYHYVELELNRSVDAFFIEWATRLGEPKNSPMVVGITLGTDYSPSSVGEEFVLGDAVVTEAELAAEKQLFVLRGNAIKSFTAADGITYSGSGSVYMQYAEEGDVEPSAVHVMQLIPAGDDRYLVYWPVAGKFLANSASHFNGLNGWQYSTANIEEAAVINFTATDGSYFGMHYESTHNDSPITLYIGAEMRDGVYSKMKTFDLEHKNYLEEGDYTKGYALPIAFNWSIYKAELDARLSDLA